LGLKRQETWRDAVIRKSKKLQKYPTPCSRSIREPKNRGMLPQWTWRCWWGGQGSGVRRGCCVAIAIAIGGLPAIGRDLKLVLSGITRRNRFLWCLSVLGIHQITTTAKRGGGVVDRSVPPSSPLATGIIGIPRPTSPYRRLDVALASSSSSYRYAFILQSLSTILRYRYWWHHAEHIFAAATAAPEFYSTNKNLTSMGRWLPSEQSKIKKTIRRRGSAVRCF